MFTDFNSSEGEIEDKANSFAAAALLEPKKYLEFKNKADFSLMAIQKFANEQDIMPFIVIGRLKKEKYLKYSDYSGEMRQYKCGQSLLTKNIGSKPIPKVQVSAM